MRIAKLGKIFFPLSKVFDQSGNLLGDLYTNRKLFSGLADPLKSSGLLENSAQNPLARLS